ncbi:hypothetical protein D1816_18020 [Aquimarina sp. AD10]|uniref:class I lanthipeptide n=1 Tax=Aquimarina sp. AD10 TaxID=1714849 RepID=UPI000E47E77C|nr:class I lanthipeptide [Aquimarina sp. AD10]AXT62174.1 hypothetical protein D1816_18020 [Aquimarina sp. AD10]RKM90631.1 hypothetical protein D7033_24360 [Aquimarina sp. AD10]
MKNKKGKRKLVLGKIKVAQLNDESLKEINGGTSHCGFQSRDAKICKRSKWWICDPIQVDNIA